MFIALRYFFVYKYLTDKPLCHIISIRHKGTNVQNDRRKSMDIKIYYENTMIVSGTGDNVIAIVEDKFGKLIPTITKYAGNGAGCELVNVYMEYDTEKKVAWLHVFAHGSDGLIGYDATEDKDKEVVFRVAGVAAEDLPEKHIFELVENKFDPFNPKHLENKTVTLGILKQCADHLAESKGKYAPRVLPSEMVDRKYPTMQKHNLPVYISQLMLQFSLAGVKKTEKNEKIFDLIEKAIVALGGVKGVDETDIIAYYKTKNYFENAEKTTALQYYRKKAGLSQKEVADAVGMSLRQYQRYEAPVSGLGDAKKAVIEKIAEVVGCTMNDIICNGIPVLK